MMRSDASARYGGDTRLAYETVHALREIGVDVDLVESETPDLRGYDLGHVMNIGEPSIAAKHVAACEAAGVPYVISPVWLDLAEMFGRGFKFEHTLVHERSANAAAARLAALRRTDNRKLINRRDRALLQRRLEWQSKLLRGARVLLPNSAAEAKDCMLRLGVRDVPMVVVPIAANLEPASAWQRDRRGVAMVGRVETRKNQVTSVFALRDEGYPIDVIGNFDDNSLTTACTRWTAQVRFHGRVSREMLLEMLGRAHVHVLASWCETAGIASMEAAAAGAQIVVGDRGAEYEYFGEDAEYADPADPESIRSAVQRAFARPPREPGDALDQRIRRFTWRYAAEETLRAYRMALAPRLHVVGQAASTHGELKFAAPDPPRPRV